VINKVKMNEILVKLAMRFYLKLDTWK